MSREITHVVKVGEKTRDVWQEYAIFVAAEAAIDLAVREIVPKDCLVTKKGGDVFVGIKITVEGIAPQEEA